MGTLVRRAAGLDGGALIEVGGGAGWAGRPGPVRYRNDLMHNHHLAVQSLAPHTCLHMTGRNGGRLLMCLIEINIELFASLLFVAGFTFVYIFNHNKLC